MKKEYKDKISKLQELNLEPIDIKHKSEKMRITIDEVALYFGVTKKRIWDAYKGEAPALLYDIYQYLKEQENKIIGISNKTLYESKNISNTYNGENYVQGN